MEKYKKGEEGKDDDRWAIIGRFSRGVGVLRRIMNAKDMQDYWTMGRNNGGWGGGVG